MESYAIFLADFWFVFAEVSQRRLQLRYVLRAGCKRFERREGKLPGIAPSELAFHRRFKADVSRRIPAIQKRIADHIFVEPENQILVLGDLILKVSAFYFQGVGQFGAAG